MIVGATVVATSNSLWQVFLKQILTVITRLIRGDLIIGLNLLIRQQVFHQQQWPLRVSNWACHPIFLFTLCILKVLLFHNIPFLPYIISIISYLTQGNTITQPYNVSLMYSPWFLKEIRLDEGLCTGGIGTNCIIRLDLSKHSYSTILIYFLNKKTFISKMKIAFGEGGHIEWLAKHVWLSVRGCAVFHAFRVLKLFDWCF